MKVIIVILCWFFVLFGGICYSKKEGNFYNPCFIYFMYWSLVIGFAFMQLFELISVPLRIYKIVIIGVLSFLVACGIASRRKRKKKISVYRISGELRIDSIKILACVLLCMQLPFLLKIIMFLIEGGKFVQVKTLYYSGKTFSGNYQMGLFTHVMQPLCLLIASMSVINFFSKDKRDIVLFVLSLVLIVNCYILSGRRIYLGYYIIMFLLMILRNGNSSNIKLKITVNLKHMKILIMLAVMSVLFLICMDAKERNILNGIKNMYIYICGCIPCFYRHEDLLEIYRFKGMASFIGILALIDNIIPISSYNDTLSVLSILQNAVHITDNKADVFNAFVTSFYYNYLDFGMAGVVIFSAFHGLIMGKAYGKAKENDVRAIIIYMIFFVDMFFSCMSYCFVSVITVDMLVWGIVIFYSPIKRIFLKLN